MKHLISQALRAIGIEVKRYRPHAVPRDVCAEDREILRRIAGYSMTSVDRQIALVHAVRYLLRRGIDGCFVECGVWRGGSSMAVALTLLSENVTNRDLYLFDTFEGMTMPSAHDRTTDGTSAQVHLKRNKNKSGIWCVAGEDEVQENMASTGYPLNHIHLVKGPVEETIPKQNPNAPIALLRLDTDWYGSTKHELVHLFPRLSDGGILIIDDYGHWEGAKKAVDEYFGDQPQTYYMHRIDYTGRLIIKQ